MSDAGMTPMSAADQSPSALAHLREKVNEFVGITFFMPLLQNVQQSNLKGKYGHGGRGEEMFRAQLNLELARRAGQAGRLGIDEAIFRRLGAACERGGSRRD